jgi:hypothetical protein
MKLIKPNTGIEMLQAIEETVFANRKPKEC